VIDRVARVLHAVAAAEAATWTGPYQRALLLPYWTRRKRREIEDDHDREGLLSMPVPFALNQPTADLRAGPGPRSEWLAFELLVLADAAGRYDREVALRAWHRLAEGAEAPRLTLGQRAALDHLRAGRTPPRSGHDHPHYFDDAASVRAIALAVALPDDDGELLAAVAADAAISNAEDGAWAAEAVAIAIARLQRGSDAHEALSAARARLPDGSWVAERVDHAGSLARSDDDPLGLALRLDHRVANAGYSYADAAPDVLAIAFTILRTFHPRVEAALLAASAVPRHAAAVVPLVAALCAAGGQLVAPLARLNERHPALAGVALPHLRGRHLADLADAVTIDERG
jgi:hypothetical protein